MSEESKKPAVTLTDILANAQEIKVGDATHFYDKSTGKILPFEKPIEEK